jgi:hypothetical protein
MQRGPSKICDTLMSVSDETPTQQEAKKTDTTYIFAMC